MENGQWTAQRRYNGSCDKEHGKNWGIVAESIRVDRMRSVGGDLKARRPLF
jgi:hypothetical protein